MALAVIASLCCAVAAHYAIVAAQSPTPGALLSLVPVALIGLALARRARSRAIVAAALVLAALAAWLGWPLLERNFTDLFFVEHAGANLVLAIVFGRTLLAGREPLCTRFARMIHGALEPDALRYTREVTLAWTLFFAALCALSCGLYLGGFLEAWSILANIASPLLVAAMFAIEYAVRARVLPTHAQVGILGGIQAFSRHFGTTTLEAPR
jgi:uncharacterized membrane protein